MRGLLLVAALVMVALTMCALGICLLVRASRVNRRKHIVALLAERTSGARHRPRSRRVRRSIVLELADRLSGSSLPEEVPWLSDVVRDATADLGSRRWVRRARGLRTLHPLGLRDDIIRRALEDVDPRVRALAATLGSGRTDGRLLRRLVKLLDDPMPMVRHSALDALTRRGPGSTSALYDALVATQVLAPADLPAEDRCAATADTTADRVAREPGRGASSAPGTARTERVAPGLVAVTVPSDGAGAASTVPRPLRATAPVSDRTRTLLLVLRATAASAEEALLPAARRFLSDARPDVRALTVRTLAVLGESADVLVPALSDGDGRVRTEAVAALGRLGARSHAGLLAVALSDRDHAVRTAAAAALTRLDGAGRLLLQRAMRGSDRYAADAARAALGLPPELRGDPTGTPPDGPGPAETGVVTPPKRPAHAA